MPSNIIDKISEDINGFPIPINNINDKLAWNLLQWRFLYKNSYLGNNSSVSPHSKAKFRNSLSKLDLRSKLQLFAWKLVWDIFPTRGKVRKFGIDIDGECPLRNKTEETLDHLFINCEFACNVVSIIIVLPPTSTNFTITDWMEYIWTHKNRYHKLYDNLLEKL